MNQNMVDSIVDFILLDSVSKQEIQVRFHGGEPLLEFAVIQEFVEKLNKEMKPKRYYITTNAILLNYEMICFFRDNRFELNVSLDGDRQTHDRNRKDKFGEGTFDIVINRIYLLQKENMPFTVRGTFNSLSVYNLHENVKYMYEIGIKKIAIMPDSFDNNWDEVSIKILKNELGKNIHFRKDLAIKGKDVEIALTNKYECKVLGFCSGGKTSFSILPNGDLYPCIYAVNMEDCLIGNVKTGLLPEKINKLLEICKEPLNECAGCNFKVFCSCTRCKYINRLQTGEYNLPDSRQCNIESVIGRTLRSNGF